MKIKEVSLKTGLTKKTIRYYEEVGLLSPEKTWKNGREYRSYSEENVRELLKIAELRRARFSIEEISHIQSVPADIPQVFSDYRARLQAEQANLGAVLAVVNQIAPERLTDEDTLIDNVRPITIGLPLPAVDLDPHFRYLDELEELGSLVKSRMTPQERRQKELAAVNAAMYSGASTRFGADSEMASGVGGGFDISTSQKMAAYNLLVNTKDE